MNPHDGQTDRSRCSVSGTSRTRRVPQFAQKFSVRATHPGAPSPDAMSVDRPSSPRPIAANRPTSSGSSARSREGGAEGPSSTSSVAPSGASSPATSGPHDEDDGEHDQRQEHDADDHPG